MISDYDDSGHVAPLQACSGGQKGRSYEIYEATR